jgi:hypothetical protein
VTMKLGWAGFVPISYYFGTCLITSRENDTMTIVVRTTPSGTRVGSSSVNIVGSASQEMSCS